MAAPRHALLRPFSATLAARSTRAMPTTAFRTTSRTFTSTRTASQAADGAAPVKRPVGAFRGGMFGFLLGSTLAGAGVYYYILEEYRVSNELLTEDIYNMQAAVQRIEAYTRNLDEQVTDLQKRSKS